MMADAFLTFQARSSPGVIFMLWKGLDKDVGIVNWHGGLEGKNCKFFADLGLKQILSGYYANLDSYGIRFFSTYLGCLLEVQKRPFFGAELSVHPI